MHPPLYRYHPKCGDIVELFARCHEEHKWGKFFGKCNDIKAQLDQCFKREKEEMRDENLRKARDFEARFERHVARLQELKNSKETSK
jgi:COX assembly mitochondrial protein 2